MDTSSERLLTPAGLPTVDAEAEHNAADVFAGTALLELRSNEKLENLEIGSSGKADSDVDIAKMPTPERKRKRVQLEKDVTVLEIHPEPLVSGSQNGPSDVIESQVDSGQLPESSQLAKTSENDGCGTSSPLKKKTRSMLPAVPEERSAEDVEVEIMPNEQTYESKCPCFKYCRRINKLSNSMYMVPVHLIIFAFAVSAGLMGARYMKECPMSPSVPLLLFMMSLAALLSVMLRMVDVCTRWLFPVDSCGFLGVFSTFGFLTHILLLTTEILAYMKVSPSFDESAENFCNPTFYSFLGWINWLSVAFGFSMAFLHIPALIPNSVLYS